MLAAFSLWLFGIDQECNALPSRPHSNLIPRSVDLKLKLALVLLGSAGGLVVMVVSGAVVSMVQVKLAGVASMFPAGSIARTWKVWLPAASALYLFGLVHAANAPPSSLHSKVLPALVAVKLKVA